MDGEPQLLTTNLLPPQDKKIFETEIKGRITVFFAAALVVILGVGLVLLFPSYLPLFLEKRELERALVSGSDTARALKTAETIQRAKAVQGVISSFRNFSANSDRPSRTLDIFFDGVKPGLQILSLSVKKDGEANIGGFAKTRKDLLDFEKYLRSSGKFQELFSPLSNFIKESDINFSIKVKIKPPYGLQ